MRSRRRFWWAISLAVGPIVLSGCATRASLPEIEGLPGALAGTIGRRGVVIAAPHGISDARTDDIVAELGRRTGFGVVIATGFNLEPDTREGAGRRPKRSPPRALGRSTRRTSDACVRSRRGRSPFMPRSTATTITTR